MKKWSGFQGSGNENNREEEHDREVENRCGAACAYGGPTTAGGAALAEIRRNAIDGP